MSAPLALQGVFPIIATPFTPEGEVDYTSLEQLLDTLAKGGCHALTLFGIAGEYYKLTHDERLRMVELTIDRCRAHGVPSIISVTDHAWEVARETARQYERMGTDALMLLPPFFLKPTAADMETHIRKVGEAVTIPIMLQYAPEQTGVSIPPSVFANIARDLPNVRDFKIESRPVGHYIRDLLDLTDGNVRIHVGNAGFNVVEAYRRGAVGMMPGCSMYEIYLRLHDELSAGHMTAAMETHGRLVELLNHIRQNVPMIIAFEKQVLHKRGIIASPTCRAPSYPIDATDQALFDTLYTRLLQHVDPHRFP